MRNKSGWVHAWTVGRMADDHRREPYLRNPRIEARVCSSSGCEFIGAAEERKRRDNELSGCFMGNQGRDE